MVAATFGNVHGVYKPGNVVLTPTILNDIQTAVGAKYGKDKPFDLVFHGGSGSLLSEIREALDYGVVKMNIDTDTQYAFTRPVADHMFKNYDGVLKVDGEVGNKKQYDPRAWGKRPRRAWPPAWCSLPGPPVRRHQDALTHRLSRIAGQVTKSGPSKARISSFLPPFGRRPVGERLPR